MSEALTLNASLRQGNTDSKDMIKGVMYGAGVETSSLEVKRLEFENLFAKTGESGLITLTFADGRKEPVLVKDLQFDAVKHRIIHVDFYRVNMKEKVTAEVNLEFVGESPAVKAQGGIVVYNVDALEIEALPSDLIQKVDVDLSKLANLGDAIHVSDITLPQGVVFKSEPETMIAQVVEPKKTVEDTAADAAIEAAAEANAANAASGGSAAKAEDKK